MAFKVGLTLFYAVIAALASFGEKNLAQSAMIIGFVMLTAFPLMWNKRELAKSILRSAGVFAFGLVTLVPSAHPAVIAIKILSLAMMFWLARPLREEPLI